jgi:hypothetical protein
MLRPILSEASDTRTNHEIVICAIFLRPAHLNLTAIGGVYASPDLGVMTPTKMGSFYGIETGENGGSDGGETLENDYGA